MSSVLAAISAIFKTEYLSPMQPAVSVGFIQSSVQFLENFKDENDVLILSYSHMICNTFKYEPFKKYVPVSSAADPGCLSRIRIFSIPDHGSRVTRFRIHIKEFKYF
jgi:hypothetical protein